MQGRGLVLQSGWQACLCGSCGALSISREAENEMGTSGQLCRAECRLGYRAQMHSVLQRVRALEGEQGS